MKKFIEKVKKAFENPIVFFFGGWVVLGSIIGAVLWVVRHL